MARPMLSGRIDGQGPSPVAHNRTWLAALLLVAFVAFGAWQWQTSPQGLLSDAGANRVIQGRDAGHHEEDDD